jgi:hypothetical protein
MSDIWRPLVPTPMVQDDSDLGIWFLPSIEMDGVAPIFPPFFDRLVHIIEMDEFREELLDFLSGRLVFIRWR